jgi:ferredoxin-NADP reductase
MVRRQDEYDDVATFVFERASRVVFEAGQYAWVDLSGRRDRALMRELSFASAPSDDEVWFTVHVRRGSAFKQRLAALEAGELVQAYDVRGRMVAPEDLARPSVMVAQGIGVTPVRSLLREHAGARGADGRGGLRARVIHVAGGHYLFGEELRRLAARYQPVGRAELAGLLAEVASGWDGEPFYVSGAPEFVARVARDLGLLGVPYPAIRSTMFDAYGELD